MSSKRGAVLLVVLGVLFVLASLGVAFARLTRFERDASTSRSDHVQARFCAEAGVEQALSEIRRASTRPWDGPGASWFYRGRPGLASGNGVPLDEATLPSFYAGNTADGNLAIARNGLGRPYSGMLPPTYEPSGDTYVVRVLDAASMIDLNAPTDPRRPLSEQPLVRMLENLSRAIDRADPPLTALEAESVLAYRETLPDGRFESKNQLLSVPWGAVRTSELRLLEDFVTCHAWTDPYTVAPMDPAYVPVAGDLVPGRIPTGTPVLAPRAPIDLNTAPPEVLVAVLADLAAVRVERDLDRRASEEAWRAAGVATRTDPVRFDQAVRLAGEIAIRREANPFRSWDDFVRFLEEMTARGDLDRFQALAILANADPNTDTHRANPDRVLWREIDKFDLVVSTTEFAFQSGGVFEIESLGRVTHEGGFIRAQAEIRTVVSVYSLARQTAQSQFVRGRASSYRLAEPLFYQPDAAVLTELDLELDGDVEVTGNEGNVHSNGDLDLIGTPSVDGDATASGSYDGGKQAEVGGLFGGGYPREWIPVLDPSSYREYADYVFAADGMVYDKAGQVVGKNQFAGFNFGGGSWQWNGPAQIEGILFFEGDVKLAANTKTPWKATIVATGSISIQGSVQLAPSQGLGLSLMAGTDVKVTGRPGTVISGIVYAGEQIDLGGNADYLGAFIARDTESRDGLVKENRLHGSARVKYDGSFAPLPLGWFTSTWPTSHTYPEPDATIQADGAPLHLPSWASYDGYVCVNPLTTSIAILGPLPYRDRLLARWNTGSLDATEAGGSKSMVRDTAGPAIAPLAGPSLVGHLLPDGIYSETEAVPAYEAMDNVGPVAGTISFWLKPSWDAARGALEPTNRSHHLLSLSETTAAGTRSFQLARAGDWNGPWRDVMGFHFERSRLESATADRLEYSSWTPPAHQWTHVVLVWDFLADSPDQAIALYVNGAEIPGAARDFLRTEGLRPEELAEAALSPATLLRLGERIGNDYQLPAVSAEATLDEVVSIREKKDAAWAAARYAEGRYFSGGDAWYESADLAIPAGSEVLHAAWTVRYPGGWQGQSVRLQIEEGGIAIGSTVDPTGLSLGGRVQRPVRYRVVFQDRPTGGPLYETPVVDDVTIAYASSPRVQVWEENP